MRIFPHPDHELLRTNDYRASPTLEGKTSKNSNEGFDPIATFIAKILRTINLI